MPIYEYRCAACGHTLEALQKLSDAPLKKCPQCARSRLKRLVSAPSFRLKGGGWYETDFKQSGEKKRNLVDGGGEASKSMGEGKDGAKSDGAKSDSKPATKTDGTKTAAAPKESTAKSSSQASSDSASG
jgi:putative FmdB family regulatory protein